MRELYFFKESLHRLYRCKGLKRARRALINLCDQMSKSSIKEILTLRKTLIKWATEILNYFENRLTNARTEGFILHPNFGFKSMTGEYAPKPSTP